MYPETYSEMAKHIAHGIPYHIRNTQYSIHVSPDDTLSHQRLTTTTTTVAPLAPFVEVQGLTKVPGVSFVCHGTLFV